LSSPSESGALFVMHVSPMTKTIVSRMVRMR
jgi:hypothetical protein